MTFGLRLLLERTHLYLVKFNGTKLKVEMKNGFKNKYKITGELFVNTEYKCLCGNEKVKIQDPKNNLIQEISLEELYLLEQENLVH